MGVDDREESLLQLAQLLLHWLQLWAPRPGTFPFG
jgi:hypothetical protein